MEVSYYGSTATRALKKKFSDRFFGRFHWKNFFYDILFSCQPTSYYVDLSKSMTTSILLSVWFNSYRIKTLLVLTYYDCISVSSETSPFLADTKILFNLFGIFGLVWGALYLPLLHGQRGKFYHEIETVVIQNVNISEKHTVHSPSLNWSRKINLPPSVSFLLYFRSSKTLMLIVIKSTTSLDYFTSWRDFELVLKISFYVSFENNIWEKRNNSRTSVKLSLNSLCILINCHWQAQHTYILYFYNDL